MSQQEEKYLDATSDKKFYLFQVFLFRCLSTLAVWLGPEIVWAPPKTGFRGQIGIRGELSVFWPRSLQPINKLYHSSGVGGRLHPDLLLARRHLGRHDHLGQLQQVQEQRVPRRHHGRLRQLHDQLLRRFCHLRDHRVHGSWAWGARRGGGCSRWEEKAKELGIGKRTNKYLSLGSFGKLTKCAAGQQSYWLDTSRLTIGVTGREASDFVLAGKLSQAPIIMAFHPPRCWPCLYRLSRGGFQDADLSSLVHSLLHDALVSWVWHPVLHCWDRRHRSPRPIPQPEREEQKVGNVALNMILTASFQVVHTRRLPLHVLLRPEHGDQRRHLHLAAGGQPLGHLLRAHPRLPRGLRHGLDLRGGQVLGGSAIHAWLLPLSQAFLEMVLEDFFTSNCHCKLHCTDSLRLRKLIFFNMKLMNLFPSWSWTSRSRTTRGTSTTRTTIPAGRTPSVGASPSPRLYASPSSDCSRSPELREASGLASANLPPSGAKKWSKPTEHCLSVDVISIVYQPWLGSQDAPCRRPWRRYVTKLTFPFFLLHMWQLPKERWS